jgi:DNA (cytosine-5)-methyltransferase 1
MKFIDMFCGIGTIRMGFEQAGWECVYSIEWDKHKRRIYDVIFGGEPEGQDIRTIRGNDLPRADCWCFGAPCQDFSVAGERAGLEGDRSSLVREVFRQLREIEKEYRPEWLLYENVKGMFSSNKGLDYFEILFEMESLGYDIEWQLLNSKDFGVPQNRERVFTIGHLRGRSGRKIFPIGRNSESADIKVIGTTKSETAKGTNCRSWVHDITGIVGALTSTDYKQPKQIMIKGMLDIPGQENIRRVYDTKGISPCLTTMEGGNRQPKIQVRDYSEVAILRNVRTDYGKNIRKQYEAGEIKESRHNMTRLEPRVDGINNTLTTVQKDNLLFIREATSKGYAEALEGDSINLAVPGSKTRRGRVGKSIANTLDTSCNQGTLANGRIRRLTPKECWRLQGISDKITDKVIQAGISDTQMYRGAGDACTVNVIYEIAKRMR